MKLLLIDIDILATLGQQSMLKYCNLDRLDKVLPTKLDPKLRVRKLEPNKKKGANVPDPAQPEL